MAKGNGRLTAKSVSVWFEAVPLVEQVALLDELQKIQSKVRQVQINSLKRQLAALENGPSNGQAAPKAPKPDADLSRDVSRHDVGARYPRASPCVSLSAVAA